METIAIAFSGHTCLAQGPLSEVALAVKACPSLEPVLVFDATTSQPIELDLRGTNQEILARLMPPPTPPVGPGRPKLGVVAREVTLLPRHWEWLGQQPGGTSVALRKLVEEARRSNEATDKKRLAQEVTYRFLSAIAGNLPGFEEATRALFAGSADSFAAHTQGWPEGIRAHALSLAAAAVA